MATDAAKPNCEGSAWNYVVTAHKPTAVHQAVVGSFTAAGQLNLIVGKNTRLEIHNITTEGLQGLLDVPIYGSIAHLELFRPKGMDKDLLFLLTQQTLQFCVLEYDSAAGELRTRAQGVVKDLTPSKREGGPLCTIDPECRLIGFSLACGCFKVIPVDVDSGTFGQQFNIRIEHLKILQLSFLYNVKQPTIAVLYSDQKGTHVATYEVSVDKKALEGPTQTWPLDLTAHRLIPIAAPAGGLVVVADTMIAYLQEGQDMKTLPIEENVFTAHGRIDPLRYLLGDWRGGLHVLVLIHEGSSNTITELKLELLGATSAATCLAYLDNGIVFVGSKFADSQLIRLLDSNPDQPTNYVELLDTYPNLGPIIDLTVVDLERQGQGQVVTCSNVLTDGSLRVVRNGIGINEQASLELAGIKGVWSLRKTWMDAFDTYLVLTFVAETHILGLTSDEELDEAVIPGFDADADTLLCANMASDHLLQVTSRAVRLVDCGTQELVHTWEPPAGVAINVAACSPTQVLVGAAGGHLIYLEVVEAKLVEKSNLKLEEEIACVDMSPIGSGSDVSQLCVLGTWGLQLQLLTLTDLRLVAEETLMGEVIPRSVLLANFEDIPYVLCGLGDGVLHSWRLDPGSGAFGERKKLSLGTKPLLLHTFKVNGSSHVLAASDRPTVIHSANKKLLYSNLNENDVSFIASFNAANFPDSLAMAKDESLVIGTVDQIQKLHIRTVPLREQPRRICHQDSTNTFGVCTHYLPPGSDKEDGYLRVMDDQTFEVLASHKLDPTEAPCSLLSARFGDDTEYFVVGTAYIKNEPEPTEGRVLVLQYFAGGRLEVVAELRVKGEVSDMCSFQGKLLAGVGNFVCVFALDGSTLSTECRRSVNVMVQRVAARGDHIVVGDLMRSVSLLIYKPNDPEKLELRGSDLNLAWTVAVHMLDDDTYLVAENFCNIYVVKKNSDSAMEEDRHCLQVVGRYHVGSFINRFRPGSLVMKLPDSELSGVATSLFGTIDGVIGVVATLPHDLFTFLDKLQTCLRGVIKGVGGFDHAEWRSHKDELSTKSAHNIIDGDLIEQFLELPESSMQQVVAEMGDGVTLEELYKKVEELARLH